MGKINPYLLLILSGVLFFIPFLGGVHLFDWDEVNFAEISREMIVSGNYLRPTVNFQPFWEKPPLFFWLQVLSMKAFGINEFSARFPNAILGILTLIVLYAIGNHLKDRRFGLIWALVYAGSVLPHLYFRSGIIDPVFNFFIFTGIYFFILFYWNTSGIRKFKGKPVTWLFLSGLFIGLAMLTKGPVGYLIPLLTLGTYWVYKRFRFYIGIRWFVLLTLLAFAVTFLWYGVDIALHGTWFVNLFMKYQLRLLSTEDAGHGGFPGYHFVVILVGCFPASLFAIRAFYRMKQQEVYLEDFRMWMMILFWVVLILFSIVQSKIVHYSSLAYFPLTFLAALTAEQILDRQIPVPAWLRPALAAIGLVYALATIVLPLLAKNIEWVKPLFAKDPFALANLGAQVHWTGLEVLPGLLMLAILAASAWLYRGIKPGKSLIVLFAGTALFVNLTLYFFIGRIEGYSQRTAVEFCKNLQGKDCYVITSGYKSYVQLFYTRFQPHTNERYTDKDWLLKGDIDKDVYILTKIHRAHEIACLPGIEQIGSENGFVFFRRQAGR